MGLAGWELPDQRILGGAFSSWYQGFVYGVSVFVVFLLLFHIAMFCKTVFIHLRFLSVSAVCVSVCLCRSQWFF
jgi:hypothetical protein